jgi:hypothetical protein
MNVVKKRMSLSTDMPIVWRVNSRHQYIFYTNDSCPAREVSLWNHLHRVSSPQPYRFIIEVRQTTLAQPVSTSEFDCNNTMSSKRPKNPPDRFSPPIKKPARRGRPRKNDQDDEDDEEEAPLQTQMPMTPPRPDPPAYATRRTPASQKGASQRSTAKKAATPRPPSATKATAPPSTTKNVTVVARTSEPVPEGEIHPEEEKGEENVITELPEVKEEEQKVAVVRAKHADIVLNQYYYDIIDMEQHCVLFERSTRTERWNVLQVRFISFECVLFVVEYFS